MSGIFMHADLRDCPTCLRTPLRRLPVVSLYGTQLTEAGMRAVVLRSPEQENLAAGWLMEGVAEITLSLDVVATLFVGRPADDIRFFKRGNFDLTSVSPAKVQSNDHDRMTARRGKRWQTRC